MKALVKSRREAGLWLEDLTAIEVLAFLRYVEKERKATVRTRNCRLAAIRSFFSFVADRWYRAATVPEAEPAITIGPQTTAAALTAGLTVVAEAGTQDVAGLVDSAARWRASSRS